MKKEPARASPKHDGRWDYVWDGENRLVKLRSRSGNPATERRVEFEYDWQGRRIRQTVWNDRDDGQGSEVSDTLYLYDGWNLIAELNANSSNAKVRTYIWGLDLSGTMQGAGGVGGLLMVIDHTGTTKRHYAAYDGNGNVMALADSTTGDWSARYEYGPFGEPIRANGDLAYANPIRWSSKHTDKDSGLIYYGYRFYDAITGRWLSRDPIGQENGKEVYQFCLNDPIGCYDAFGLLTVHPYTYEYNSTSLDPDTLGQTDPVVKQTGKGVACGFLWRKIKMTGYSMDLYIKITYAQGVNPNQNVPNSTNQRTIEAHEKMHAQYAIDYATKVDNILSWLNGKCLCKPCYNAMMNYANKANKYYEMKMLNQNAQLDCADYRPGSEAQERACYHVQTTQAQIPDLQNEAVDAYNKAKKACNLK